MKNLYKYIFFVRLFKVDHAYETDTGSTYFRAAAKSSKRKSLSFLLF